MRLDIKYDDYLAESVTEITELRWVQKPDVCSCSCSRSKLSGLVMLPSEPLLERNSLCSFFLITTDASSSMAELLSSASTTWIRSL